MDVRAADERELDQLAQIWYVGWHGAHAELVPDELTRLRTLGSFRERLHAALPIVRVAGPQGRPLGFCVVKDDELYQLFVSPEARGSGIAAALVADAEARLAERGVETAWLAYAIGNARAARFYEKCGWRRAGNMINYAETSDWAVSAGGLALRKDVLPPNLIFQSSPHPNSRRTVQTAMIMAAISARSPAGTA